MDKRARVLAALGRRPVDRPPVSFWRHVPDVDHTAPGLAEAMLAFQRRWDLDFLKVMSSGVYCVEDRGCAVAYQGSPNGAKQCVEHAVQSRSDWGRIRPLDPGAGALGRELEAVRLIARGRLDDAPILHTLFSPLTVARKLAGDRLVEDLRQEPAAVEPALDAITDTMARHARAALEAGADGLFFATQTAAPEVVTPEESARFELPRMRRMLDAVAGRSGAAQPGRRARAGGRHSRAPRAEHVDRLSRAQRPQEAALRRAGATGSQLRHRRRRDHPERARSRVGSRRSSCA
jgi:uroporphyrinogen decarboxylase